MKVYTFANTEVVGFAALIRLAFAGFRLVRIRLVIIPRTAHCFIDPILQRQHLVCWPAVQHRSDHSCNCGCSCLLSTQQAEEIVIVAESIIDIPLLQS